MSAPRVLITGRYGFTGRYVAAEFAAAGGDVWGTGIAAAPETDPNFIPANLTDAVQLSDVVAKSRPDAVIHLAAIAFVAHGSAEDFYRINLIGTHLLLDAIASNDAGKSGVILASSANIYGNTDQVPIRETATPAPVNDYAVSKLSMEHMAGLFTDRLPLVLARPFNYTGRGQDAKFLVPKIVSHFRDRAPEMALGNLDVARDFSDVRDVARAYRVMVDHATCGDVINICSGHATALGDVIQMCQDITGHSIDVRVNPEFVRANEVKTLMGDSTKLDSLSPQGSTRHTFRDTLSWMLSDT